MRRLLLTIAVLFIACSPESREAVSPEIRLINLEQLDQTIENRYGKTLMLNVWATWCVPCREEFPDMIELAHQLDSQSFELIALSADFPDEIDTKVEPFIETFDKIPFKIFVQNNIKQDSLINFLDPEWNGALPATFFYDENGILQSKILGKANLPTFRSHVDSLFSAQP